MANNMELPSEREMPSPLENVFHRKVGALGEGLALGCKYLLTRIGEHCSPVHIHQINSTANYLELGRWFRQEGLQIPLRFSGGCESSRHQLFNLIAAGIRDRKVLYLEFGVREGQSIRYWAGLLKNPGSMLHGFDSFEGLPEAFNITHGKFAFSTHGMVPIVEDPRVKFFKGWFEETLPDYSVPDHDVMVVNFDADLYSSTKTVLGFLKDQIRVGTYLYFDEFNDRYHELRAFDEFLKETGLNFRAVAADKILSHVFFQRIECARS
jgi:macrocin-O-methyltransferase TylF-like protien